MLVPVEHKWVAPIGDSFRTLSRTIWVERPDAPPKPSPKYPMSDGPWPKRGEWRFTLTREEDAAISRTRIRHRYWTVGSAGEICPAIRCRVNSSKTWIFDERCPYECGEQHVHGTGEGLRSSHCTGKHPLSGMSYYLLPPGWERPQ